MTLGLPVYAVGNLLAYDLGVSAPGTAIFWILGNEVRTSSMAKGRSLIIARLETSFQFDPIQDKACRKFHGFQNRKGKGASRWAVIVKFSTFSCKNLVETPLDNLSV